MGMNNKQRKTRKPRFLTQNPKKYLKQVDDVMTDKALTAEQRTHALNGIWRDSMRQFGYYGDSFRMIDKAVSEALEQCEKCGEV